MFGVQVALIFSVLGYVMRKLDFSFATFLIGFALGRQFELFFRQTVILFSDQPFQLLYHPIAVGFVLLTFVSLWRISRQKKREASKGLAAGNERHMIERIEISKCTGCGICDIVCPADVIHMEPVDNPPEFPACARPICCR